ncbi:DUF4143 domain-containing protein [candidate division KSB1 bacterium]|nr:DUF4143 domain-containing protein [candidate division KSB1 bacterium]
MKWLEDTGLILPIQLVKAGRIPLNGYSDRNIFKVYVLDVGLLGALAKIPPDILIQGDLFFTEFKGVFVENYVAQQLKSQKEIDLYYWKSAGSAEIDFICEYNNKIFPLEAKAGINPRSKSLLFYDQKYNPNILSRTTLLNLKQNGKICNYPLYAISLFPELSEAIDLAPSITLNQTHFIKKCKKLNLHITIRKYDYLTRNDNDTRNMFSNG